MWWAPDLVERRRMCALDDRRTNGVLTCDAPSTWRDIDGFLRRTPRNGRPLSSDARDKAMREVVYERDGLRCPWCGLACRPQGVSRDYAKWAVAKALDLGALILPTTPLMVVDHITSWRIGGANHPYNLRALCVACNSTKAAIVDKRRLHSQREAVA